MLFLATFFPTWEGAAGGYDLVGEFLKATVDLADVAGLQVALGRPAGKGELKILVAAVGWASAELVTARFVPLWVGARGIEFDWRYLQMGLDSNVSLLHHVALAALVWLSTRHDLPPRLRPPLGLLLLLGGYRGFLAQWAGQALGLGQWAALGVRAGLAAALGLGALRLLVTLLPAPER
ncbi:BOS complex subunit TMEM147 [Eudromia elegans]